MLFNSIDFAIFMPLVFLIYWAINRGSLKIQNLFLLAVSYFFYGYWDWRFLSLILFSSVLDFYVGNAMHNATEKSVKKKLLYLSLFTNLGLLATFKYLNFFIDSFVGAFSLFGADLQSPTLSIILPVGISFYTFQTLSYTIDIYREKIKPTDDFVAFATFVSFFPQLVAGPIERASHLLPQFLERRKYSFLQAKQGLELIIWGLFKKVVIADRLSEYVDIVYNSPQEYQGIPLLLGTIFFAFQIYCDFSGYSDIAIGSARLLGFELMTNFRTPYFATSIKDFWARWHISLSTWFRDYVYIPLGGNRVSESRRYFNLMTTFVVSGFWHGAAWTFMIWGFIHGAINIIETWLSEKKVFKFTLPTFISRLWIFFIVCLAWVFFRANTVSDAFYILSKTFQGWGSQLSSLSQLGITIKTFIPVFSDFQIVAVAFLFFIIVEMFFGKEDINKKISQMPRTLRWGFYYALVIGILFFGAFNKADQFIYFQF